MFENLSDVLNDVLNCRAARAVPDDRVSVPRELLASRDNLEQQAVVGVLESLNVEATSNRREATD